MKLGSAEAGAKLELFLVNLRLANFERVSQESVRIDVLHAQLHLAFADSRQVKQIVNQARFQLDVAPNKLERLVHALGNILLVLERKHGSENGSQRSPQLVTEHGKKSIFRFACPFRFQ